MVVPPLKYTYTPCLLQTFLCALTQPSVIWNYYIWILVVVGTRSGSVVFLFVLGWVSCLDFHSIESPCRIFAFCEQPV